MKRERKGTVFCRGNSLYLAYWEVTGKRRQVPTGLKVGQEREAKRLLEQLRRDVREAIETGGTAARGPRTLGRYKAEWIKARYARKLSSAHDDEVRLKHAKALDDLLLDEVRPVHARDLVRDLRAK